MKAILLKAEVHKYPTQKFVLYRWHCRICDKEGLVWRWDWRYIASLGVTHMKNNHPEVDLPSVTSVEPVKVPHDWSLPHNISGTGEITLCPENCPANKSKEGK